jgi:MYXO-CTERM domain-containing protein
MKRIIAPVLAIGLTLGAAQLTHAATAIISLTDDPGTPATTEPDITTGNSESVNYVAGYDITVGSSAIWVTSLGYYDPGHDGVAAPNAQVGIFELLGLNEPLGSSVTAGSTASGFVGDYRFIALETPIELAANTTYRVVANVGNVSGTSHNETPLGGIPTFGSDLTINTSSSYSANIEGGGLTRPSLAPGAPMIYLGNFEYSTTPVPEPSVAILGLLSLGGLLRRRR